MKLLNTNQAAERLGISARRVRALIAAGTLKAHHIGQEWAIEESEVMTDDPDKKKPKPRRVGSKRKLGPNKWLLRIFRAYDSAGRRIYYSEIFHGGSRDADTRL